jgi:hypothetical protein
MTAAGGASGNEAGGSPSTGGAESGGRSGAGAGGLAVGGSAGASAGAPAGGTGGKGSGATGGTVSQGGTGGRSTGGSGGTASCTSLRNQLSSALAEAQACNPSAANALQCTGFVESECGCPQAVNNPKSEAATTYTDLVARLKKECPSICAAVLCARPTSATCSSQGPQNSGRCVARGFTTDPGGPGQGP